MRKFAPFVLAGLSFFAGCSKNYEVVVGNSHIRRQGDVLDGANILVIREPNRITKCFDYNWDLKLDFVMVSENGETREYNSSSLLSSPEVESRQKLFDVYWPRVSKKLK